MNKKKLIYLDNAATTPLDERVVESMSSTLKDVYGNPSSIHSLGRTARAKIEQARKVIANGLSASIGEIFFTSSASEANNTIINRAIVDQGVTRIITSPLEHPCVLNTCQAYDANEKIEVVMLKVNNSGEIQLEELETLLSNSDKKTLVSLAYGNNEIGNIYPIEQISKLCKNNKALLHSDAVQMIGKYHINVNELGVEYLSGTAHKLHGPKGAGFMYISGNALIKPYILGGAQERNMRAGTENIYGIIGLAKAFELAIDEMDNRQNTITELRSYMKSKLENQFSDIHFNGNQESNFMSHILSVSFPPSPKNDMLIYNLDIHGICASAGSACSSGTNTGSHVLAALDPNSERVTIRFSFSHFNTKNEIDFVIDKLSELVES